MNEHATLDAIEPGMPVYGVDGEEIGAVEAVHEGGITLAGHEVPQNAIARVERGEVHLQLAKVAFMAHRDNPIAATSGVDAASDAARPDGQ